MPERFKVVLDHARRYTSARLYLYLIRKIDSPQCSQRSGIACALSAADIPNSKEPQNWRKAPWQAHSSWQISCLGRYSCLSFGRLICFLNFSRSRFSSWAGSIQKVNKYTDLAADYHFWPIAIEILGPINESVSHFLSFG